MATTIQGEIRIGPNHQARLPPYDPKQCVDVEKQRETLAWRPNCLADSDLLMFLRAARSMAAFAGMCDGGSSEDSYLAATRDQTTTTAMEALHENAYDTGKALHDLIKKPIGHTIEKMWSEDDIKKFVRGLKQHGKNFFRIRRDLLSHKETCDLVEFYYLWKKSPAAVTHRPRQRPRRGQMIRRGKPGLGKTARATPSEVGSSASDSDSGCEDSDDNSNLSGPCGHCATAVAKEWHRDNKEGTVLCTGCKLHFEEARNDVIKALDSEGVADQKINSTDSSELAPTPAKKIRLTNDSPPTPPPLLHLPLTTAALAAVAAVSEHPAEIAATVIPPTVIQQPQTQILVASSCRADENRIGFSGAMPTENDRDDENDGDQENVSGQDDFANMMSVPGSKGPDPKIDDTECHRSKNAIFRRHWNRGTNSCARTDLVYAPIHRPPSAAATSETRAVKEKSPVRQVGADVRRVSSTAGSVAPAPVLDSSMPALQRLRDYASAATGGLGGPQDVPPESRFKPNDQPPRASPPVMQAPSMHFGALMQRQHMQTPMPYEMMTPQFDPMAAERWLAAEQQRIHWERMAAGLNPAASNEIARLQNLQMNALANSMHLTHTHAHTHLHIHAAAAARAAAMHQHPMLGFSPGGWPNRPTMDAFNASMLYGPAGPPGLPPGAFLPPHMLDPVTAERLAQQQHLHELMHQRQNAQDRDPNFY